MPTTCTASGPILKGDAVCLSGWDTVAVTHRPIVSRATAANLAALKTVFGVAKADAVDVDAVDVGAVEVLVAGEVADQSITSLSIGLSTSRLVVTKYSLGDSNRQAELRYIYDPTGEAGPVPVFDAVAERYVVGTSDENGNLAIQPRHSSDETGFPKVYNLKAYGGVPDYDVASRKGTDNLPAFKRALAAMQVAENVGAKLVADGRFYFSDTLVLNQTIVFEGTSVNEPSVDTPGSPLKRSSPGTWLIFPAINAKGARVPGIRIHGGALGEVDNPKVGQAADKTILRNLTIFCNVADADMVPEGAAATSHGVHASTQFYAENVTVEFFAGDGFHLMGYYRDPAHPDVLLGGSVDGAVVRNCAAGSCGRDGFHVEGGDATGCVIDGCYAAGNRRYGFFDATRQNTYLSCTAYVNGAPGIPSPAPGETGSEYHTEGETNTSTFIGCYAEGGDDADIKYHRSQFYGPVTIIGGAIGANYISEDSNCFILEHGVTSRAPLVYKNLAGAKSIGCSLGDMSQTVQGPGTGMIALEWATLKSAADQNIDDFTCLRYLDRPYVPPGTRGHGWWALEHNNSLYRHMIRFPTTRTNTRLPAPWFVNGIFLGRDDIGPPKVSITAAPNLPNTQDNGDPLTYEKGDVVWKSDPLPGGPIGQVCIDSGTQSLSLGIQTADPVNATDTTVKLNRVDRLAPGQYITIGDGADAYKIIEVTPANSTINITPGALIVVPVGKAVAFRPATFSTFGEVVNIGNSTSYAVDKLLTLADRYVTVTVTGRTMTLPASPVDGQTYSIKSQAGVTTKVDTAGGVLTIDGQKSVTLASGDNGTFRYSAATVEWEIR